MYNRVILQPDPSSGRSARHALEWLRHIGVQVEALTSQHSSLKIHKRAIERQLAAIAARINEQDVALLPRNIFLLLEMRGSGGVSAQLEQIARIVHEQGYWKPRETVQNYHRHDVYHLGKSAQKLFDDHAELDRRVDQLHAQLGHIKQHQQMASATTPQESFEALAATSDIASIQDEIDMIVQLLEQANHPSWFEWLFMHRGRNKIPNA